MEATKEREERKSGDGEVKLPTENSPYVQYKDMEDYKMRGYGTQGHLPVSDIPHGGTGTEAPTLPGTAVPRNNQQAVQNATDTVNSYGVP